MTQSSYPTANFPQNIEMPFNHCKACGQRFVIIHVRDRRDDYPEMYGWGAWLFQSHEYCPYCGEKNPKALFKKVIRGSPTTARKKE